jgi:hypothetical protein
MPVNPSDARYASGAIVTLIVYGWKVVEPGTLAWNFPSVAAALRAVQVMTNAVKWAIVRGSLKETAPDIAEARSSGQVLIEQTATP